MNTVFHICDSCRNPVLLCASFACFAFIILQEVCPREVNGLKTDQLKTDVWKLSLLLAPVKVSGNHSAWESRFPGRPLGDISSVQFFPTVYGADLKLMESLGILPLSPLCLRSSPPSLKRKPFVAGTGYFIRTLVCLMNWGVLLLIQTPWSGKPVTVAMRREDFQKHLLLLPLFLSLWPQLWQGDSWVPPALFVPTISSVFIPVCF